MSHAKAFTQPARHLVGLTVQQVPWNRVREGAREPRVLRTHKPGRRVCTIQGLAWVERGVASKHTSCFVLYSLTNTDIRGNLETFHEACCIQWNLPSTRTPENGFLPILRMCI